MAPITDERLPRVAAIESSRKVTPAAIRVVDVPGTGPELIGNLRQVDALLLVVRDPGQLELRVTVNGETRVVRQRAW